MSTEIISVAADLKRQVRSAIFSLVSSKVYSPGAVKYLDTIKYVHPDGFIDYFSDGIKPHNMQLDHIDDLPLESLIGLLELLAKGGD